MCSLAGCTQATARHTVHRRWGAGWLAAPCPPPTHPPLGVVCGWMLVVWNQMVGVWVVGWVGELKGTWENAPSSAAPQPRAASGRGGESLW